MTKQNKAELLLIGGIALLLLYIVRKQEEKNSSVPMEVLDKAQQPGTGY